MPRRRTSTLIPAFAQLVLLVACGAMISPFIRGALLWSVLAVLAALAGTLVVRLLTPKAVASSNPLRHVLHASPDIPARPHESLPSIPILERVRALDWFHFEKFVASLIAETGFAVERFGGAKPDGGIDLIVRFAGKTSGVQCKHWRTWKVGVKQLREFLGALTDRGFQHGIFVTLQDYSADARSFAARHQIELAGEAEIVRMMEAARCHENPVLLSILDDTRKFCPKCEAEMVLRTAAKGTGAGRQFWGCSEFPRCRSTMPSA